MPYNSPPFFNHVHFIITPQNQEKELPVFNQVYPDLFMTFSGYLHHYTGLIPKLSLEQ